MNPYRDTSTPELEREPARSNELGYETREEAGHIRCLAHGYPTPLARWHYHDEYELHLITCTSGKGFVGDWIGQFYPGHLVLTGPRLPHNWVSTELFDGSADTTTNATNSVPLRDLVIQFPHQPFAQAATLIPELHEIMPLLGRARNGIEFFGISAEVQNHWYKIKQLQGMKRLGAFCTLMAELARCKNYRLLSSVQLQSDPDPEAIERIEQVVSQIMYNFAEPLSAAEFAQAQCMSLSQFCRFFRKGTGNTFTTFVNRLRIHRACYLLMESEQQVTDICYSVGFQNLANFNRRFLDIKGTTPSEFRRQSRIRLGGAV